MGGTDDSLQQACWRSPVWPVANYCAREPIGKWGEADPAAVFCVNMPKFNGNRTEVRMPKVREQMFGKKSLHAKCS